MLEFRPIPVKRTLDQIYAVFKDDKYAFTVYFDLWSLLEDQYYVRLEPGPALRELKMSDWKEVRRKFTSLRRQFVCNIELNSLCNERFARFFGFVPVGTIDDRLVMEKN